MSKQVKSALAAIVLIAGVAAAFGIKEVRFWAWADDFRQVAGDSYASQITQLSIWLTAARQQLQQCQTSGGNCGSIIQQVAQLEAEISRLAALKAKHGG